MVTFISDNNGEPIRPARKSNPTPRRATARDQEDAPEQRRAPKPRPEQKELEKKQPEQARTEKKSPEQPQSEQPGAETSTGEPKRRPRRRGGRGRKRPAAPAEATSTLDASGPEATPGNPDTAAPKPAPAKPAASARKPAPVKAATPRAQESAWNPSKHIVEPLEGKTRFQDIDIPESILHAIADLGWQYCTPIQAAILPHALQGRDCTGKAQTGTGKTAAFLISILTRFIRHPLSPSERKNSPRALILAPTRELVQQIESDAIALAQHTNVNALAIYGGSSYHHQREALARMAPEIIIATPGRLIDLMRQQTLHLNHCEVLVIDEADRMLDMGFIPDVRTIIHRIPPRAKRHTLFFSATLTSDVVRLASQWLQNPVTVEIEPENVAVDTVDQRVYIVENNKKVALLYNIMQRENPDQVLIFANRRDGVFGLNECLSKMGIRCDMISGALPQNKRERTLQDFKDKKIRVLVATDVAGRGLHISGISHVINFNLPTDPEDYVHRIGRTGRAGASGTSISFACEDDSFYLADIETYIGRTLPCEQPDDEWLVLPEGMTGEVKRRSSRPSGGGRRPPPRGGNRPPRRSPPRR